MIVLVDEAIEDLEALRKPSFPRIDPPAAGLSNVKKGQSEAKKNYSDLAMVYNKKMADLNFRFTERSGLPEGEVETLPRLFPIR